MSLVVCGASSKSHRGPVQWVQGVAGMFAGALCLGSPGLQPQPHLLVFFGPASLPQGQGEAHQVYSASLCYLQHM